MDKKSCANATRMTTWDVVWKWRGTDASSAASFYEELNRLPAADGTKVKAKLEQDVVFSADRESGILSASGKIWPESDQAKRRLPVLLGELASESLLEVVAAKALEASCGRPIAQSKWELETVDDDPLSSIEFTHWTRKSGSSPSLLELSFKSDDRSSGSQLASRVREQLSSNGLLPKGAPMTKTTWAQANCEPD